MSAGTVRTYPRAIQACPEHADGKGLQVFPANPADVALHRAERSPRLGLGRATRLGEPSGRTGMIRAYALDRWHAANRHGDARPGDDQSVLDVIAAARRDGPAPRHRSDPLFAEDLAAALRLPPDATAGRDDARDDLLLVLIPTHGSDRRRSPGSRPATPHLVVEGLVVRTYRPPSSCSPDATTPPGLSERTRASRLRRRPSSGRPPGARLPQTSAPETPAPATTMTPPDGGSSATPTGTP